ncbi:MAG: hypothetical protein ACD_2C00091G0008 [uncultured bacterium (gcode 4)]|uniref:Uncharacterized protein n=1 Tax=uncultured bacterium (gcode 4) TaxID=1234023 RepID=K2G687_9BACT|nr:MAG: hypothetical protein ACD_2C00091G0008 [uncultured bacterium (gcode 4)]
MGQEKIIETKTCRLCSASFDITDKDLEFYDKVSPVFNSEKYSIPTPTLCPECRQQRRLSFRNERKLYHRKCDLTWKQIISIYSPDKPYKVYEQSEWWSDRWNPLDYGRDFDFSRWFFEQFEELGLRTPKMSLVLLNVENSDYNNQSWKLKDSYLLVNSNRSERSFYWKWVNDSTDSTDCMKIYNCQNCYECINCYGCFKLTHSMNCHSCSNSHYLSNCTDCKDCFWCSWMDHAEYSIFNIAYSKEEYMEKIMDLSRIKKEKLNEFIADHYAKFPKISLYIENSENSLWDYITGCKNSNQAYDIKNCIDVKYSSDIVNSQDVYDIDYFGFWLNNSYDSVTVWMHSSKILFSADIWDNSLNANYCIECFSIKDCFGCIWLRNSQYCILNKQYSKEDYGLLVPKIIEHMRETGEWWEFFPASISPFWYNETLASDNYPINRWDAINRISTNDKAIFKWSDYEKQNWYDWEFYEPLEISQYDKNEVSEEIAGNNTRELLNWILKCESTKKPFRITKQELLFYIGNNIQIPKKHPDQRHLERIKRRNQRKLYDTVCAKCNKEIKTTCSPEKKEMIYCESCYGRHSK